MAMSSIHHCPPFSLSASIHFPFICLFFYNLVALSCACEHLAPGRFSCLIYGNIGPGSHVVVSACFDAGGTLLSRPLPERCTLRHVGKNKHKWAQSHWVVSALILLSDSLKVLLFFVLFVFWWFSFLKQRRDTVLLQKTIKKKMKG